MVNVTLYYRDDCPACDQVVQDLEQLQTDYPHKLVKVNVEADATLNARYSTLVPIVHIGPYQLRTTISRQDLQIAMGAARDRQNYLEQNDDTFVRRQERGKTLTGSDRFSFWLSTNYVWVFNFMVFLYVGLPFLAPVLMKAGAEWPAKAIYTIYSPLCHQLPFRSFFLFGEQPYYPRELAGIPGVITYNQLTDNAPLDLFRARSFIGNEVVGYKVAICERDVAIYGSLLLFGILFGLTGRKIPSLPWYYWILFGLVPVGIDGVSQLAGLPGWGFLSFLPARESTPFLRLLTGTLFGGTTAWYLYPLIEESMRETHVVLLRKMAVIDQTQPKS